MRTEHFQRSPGRFSSVMLMCASVCATTLLLLSSPAILTMGTVLREVMATVSQMWVLLSRFVIVFRMDGNQSIIWGPRSNGGCIKTEAGGVSGVLNVGSWAR